MRLANLVLNRLDHLWFWILLQQFDPVDYLMDIGCGEKPQDFVRVRKRHYAIDPTMIRAHSSNEYPVFRVKGDWHHALMLARNNPVDIIVLMDVVEHLDKKEGLFLLKETMLLDKQIVVFTPLGFLEQEDGEWNTHRSGWYPWDFDRWKEVHILQRFHWCDFRGRKYPEPKGAILAVYK